MELKFFLFTLNLIRCGAPPRSRFKNRKYTTANSDVSSLSKSFGNFNIGGNSENTTADGDVSSLSKIFGNGNIGGDTSSNTSKQDEEKAIMRDELFRAKTCEAKEKKINEMKHKCKSVKDTIKSYEQEKFLIEHLKNLHKTTLDIIKQYTVKWATKIVIFVKSKGSKSEYTKDVFRSFLEQETVYGLLLSILNIQQGIASTNPDQPNDCATDGRATKSEYLHIKDFKFSQFTFDIVFWLESNNNQVTITPFLSSDNVAELKKRKKQLKRLKSRR